MKILALTISVILIAGLAAAFIAVVRSSREQVAYEPIAARANSLRSKLFWLIVLVVGPIMLYTLAELPYQAMAANSQAAPETVRVTGRMWHWELDKTRVAAGSPVDFRVTSADVNHGFAIYDADMRLVGQTQAMPGYVNTLRLTFSRPGTYRVMCLEYCGLAHHVMGSALTVVEKTGGPA